MTITEQDGARRVTLADVLTAHPGPLKVDSSGEHHGACPMPGCDADTDGWWTAERDGRLIVQCRKCRASFPDLLSALGLRTAATNGAGLHIPPVFGSRRERIPAVSGTRRWSCTGPDGGRVHVRTDGGPDGKQIRWDGVDGPGSKRLLYVVPLPPGAPPGLPLVVTEGEPDADAAAALYGDGVQVVGTVCGAGVQPERDVWESLGVSGRRVLLWPDNDDIGAKHMEGIEAAVLELGAAAVLTVDPLRLGLTGKGDGAADWQPPAGADVRAILRAASAEPDNAQSHVRAILNENPRVTLRAEVVSGLVQSGYERADARRFAAAAVPDAPLPAGDKMPLLLDLEAVKQPPAILPGLLWAGLVSVLSAAPKAGKSTLLAHALAAVYSGTSFLEETGVDPDRPICLWTEMQPGMLAGWVRRNLEMPTAPIYCEPMARRRPHRSAGR